MPLLKIDDILNNRKSKLQSNTSIPPMSISFNFNQPSSSVTTFNTPPNKKIFSIVAWNVQDYKSDKMSNPFVNDFVRLVADKLSVDLLILIETDFDLTELAANIEYTDPQNFGGLLIKPPSAPKDEDWSDITDPVKKIAHLEEMAKALPQFNLFASEIAHRRVDPPAQFTAAQLQTTKFKPNNSEYNEWVELLEGLKPCYTVTDKNFPSVLNDYDSLILAAKKNPQHFFNNIAPNIVFDLITVCANCKGAALGQQNCLWCNGSGKTFTGNCTACQGTGKQNIVCKVCEGTGDYSVESETRVLQTLRDIVKREIVPGVDTETYTMFWRKSGNEVSSKFTMSAVPAPDEKAVWLNPQGCGLASTDDKGNELGYQNPKSKFNGRCPYVIPLAMTLNRKKYFVPMAVLHTIWGIASAKKGATPQEKADVKLKNKNAEEGRAESVLKMLDLGVLNGTQRVQIKSTTNFILLGDLNLDYKPTSKRGYDFTAYNNIRNALANATGNSNDLILPVIGGTKSVFTILETAYKKNFKASAIYTNAYDQFLIAKSSEIYSEVVNGGVIDVLSILKAELQSNSNLQNSVDKDIQNQTNSKGKPLFNLKNMTITDDFRAFYIYRKYVSDHLPIILDILVDETSPEEKKQVEEQKKLSFQPSQPKIETIPHYGVWQNLAPSTNTQDVLKIENQQAGIIGNVTAIVFPDCVIISATDTRSNQTHSWVGKIDTNKFDIKNFRIGQRMQGISTITQATQHTQVNAVFLNGVWNKLQAATVSKYGYKPTTDTKNAFVRGTVIAILAPDQINIEIPYKDTQLRIFQGKLTGANLSNIKIGDWLEGSFDFNQPF
jgi:hypothetical protein